ncbi:MAG: iron chelate uptake ABC transporter family permease subunit, partial [Betaproteobacteria bacterium]
MPRVSPTLTLAALLGAALLSLAFALGAGSVSIPLPDIWMSLRGGSGPGADIVLGLRVPRALSGFAVGAALALSGALLQALLRNPLADPYVLGISGGAAVAALLALALGLPAIAVQGAAISGALMTLILLFLLARRALYSTSAALGEQATGAVLLTGVMLASFAAALMSLVLALAPDGRLRTMVFWLLGDLAGATNVLP